MDEGFFYKYLSIYDNFYKNLRGKTYLNKLWNLSKIDKPKNILEIGCGSGLNMPFLTKKGKMVVGIDPSKKYLRRAERNNKHAQFCAGIGERLPFKDSSFDMVILIAVLHHCNHPKSVLEEAIRVSKSTVIVKDNLFPRGLFGNLFNGFLSLVDKPKHFFTLEEIEKMLKQIRANVKIKVINKKLVNNIFFTISNDILNFKDVIVIINK